MAEVNKLQDSLLNWITSDSCNKARFDFVKKVLDCLPTNELKDVPNLVSKAKKRRIRAKVSEQRAEKLSKLSSPVITLPTPVYSVSAPVETVSAPVYSVSAPVKTVSAPVYSVSVPVDVVTIATSSGQMKEYKISKIFFIDVEKVEMPNGRTKKGRKCYDQKAGSVAIYKLEENPKKPFFETKIFREFGSYRTTKFSEAKNGFKQTTLQDLEVCQSLESVQSFLDEEFENGLIVGINVIADIESLDLPPGNYDIFDMQWQWYRQETSPKGNSYEENLGLRSLCWHFFKEDVQPDFVIHTAAHDALWTMKLFRDVYLKIIPRPKSLKNPSCSNNISHFSKK